MSFCKPATEYLRAFVVKLCIVTYITFKGNGHSISNHQGIVGSSLKLL